MKKFIRDLFTEDDGVSWCIAKVLGFLTWLIVMIGAYHSFKNPNFMMVDFGQGIGYALAGIGAFIGLKQFTQKAG